MFYSAILAIELLFFIEISQNGKGGKMKLTIEQRDCVVKTALLYINTPRSSKFRCVDFVREVYGKIGIIISPIPPDNVPKDLSVRRDELSNPPHGYLMFLKDRNDSGKRKRVWSHVVIVLPNNNCIHCSFFFGKKVVVSSLHDLFQKRYDFAESVAS